MVITPVVTNNIGAKTVANVACWNPNEDIRKVRRSKSCPHIMNVRVCAVSNGRSVSVTRRWLLGSKKDESNPKLEETLLPAEPDDLLEADEMWSFVYEKWNKRWLRTVMCRRTRQIVAFVIGDRSETTCRQLWEHIPPTYKGCQSYSDFWEAYQLVFPVETHRCVGKGSGQTNHMERWYCTLRQSCARCVRKTLSFSKSHTMHEIVTRLFIIQYNLSLVT